MGILMPLFCLQESPVKYFGFSSRCRIFKASGACEVTQSLGLCSWSIRSVDEIAFFLPKFKHHHLDLGGVELWQWTVDKWVEPTLIIGFCWQRLIALGPQI